MALQELRSAISAYVLGLCRALASSRTSQAAEQLLDAARASLLSACDLVQAESSAAVGDEELAACRSALAAAAAAAAAAAEGQPAGALVRQQLYASTAFQGLAEALLTVVAPDWLPRFSAEQRQRLFDAWFDAAPAAALLPAIVSHLAAVQPSGLPFRGRAKVTAVSADEAAGLLAARFAAPGSPGVQQLLQHVVGLSASTLAGAEATDEAGVGAAAAAAAEQQEEGLAAALASVPERAAAVELAALEPSAYVPAVTSQLLQLQEELLSQPQQRGQVTTAADVEPAATATAEAAPAAAAAAGQAFVADVLARFCRRGHAAHVAPALLQQLRRDAQPGSPAAVASDTLAAMPDSAALDRLLDAALRAAAAQATAEAGGSPPPQLDAPPSADPAAAACAAVLTQLVPPAVWQARGDARLLLTDKLLVQQQRRLLPLAALRGLLLFLREQRESGSGGSDGSDGTGGSCSILADCAARVAQLWGDASAVQRLASPQQAYLTAALCGALALLSRQQLDAHPQLLPLLLSGTTNRLESPLQSVRRQAMRAGQALSALLDPGKPPMFADDAEQLRQLLTEETWEKAQRAQHGAAPQRTQRQQQNGGVRSGAAAATGSARQRRREERAVRRRPREVPRVQRDAGEDAEGPLTETDSDDAGGSSSDNSGMTSSGSASSAEMEPYDLEESDEDDPAKSKLQLRDLPKMLLSKAEEDWRGQLRALRHAEYLIRAAPDELPQYAVPLARALVHTKVPGWMDEEMPGAGQQGGAPSSASMQRFRNVVSLLVGAPEPAGLALAAEMYGPSMDVYQRAMILDGMAAAASEIAKPGSALPPLPGLRTAAAPQLASPAAARAEAVAAAAAAAGLMPEQQRLLTTTADGAKRVGTVTRLASRSLAAAARRAGTGPAEHVNRFPPLALKWAAALLKRCDEPQHGIDLLGRDHFLLGKLLVTLGAFMEASAQSSEAATLAAATLELMRIGRVHNHPEPYVRRAALLAGGQVLGAVPPARLATAMLGSAASGGAASGVAVSGAAAARDAADEALVSRLEWLRGWTDSVAQGDTDDSCRMMAEGVRKLQSSLAAGALAALCSGQAAAPLDGGSLLPLPSASGAGMGIPVGGLRLPDIRLP